MLEHDRIKRHVAREFGVGVEEIDGRRRTRRVAGARHAAIALCRERLDYSLTDIGEVFDRDHSTVLAAVEAARKRTLRDLYFRQSMQRIRDRLDGRRR